MKKIYLYNSLSKKREYFNPITEEVRIYSCGPTVYDFAHLGNFRSFLFSDLLHRTLKLFGYKVKLVMNITDIDDKTIENSQKQGKSLHSFTETFTKAFLQDLKTLRILPAAKYPRATQHIKEMIDMIKVLLDKNHAYVSDGSVYFRISTFLQYGKLKHLNTANQIHGAGGRIENDAHLKENFEDFVLWKKYSAEDGDVFYDSIFGKGRPGWHIECSAMSGYHLGKSFDIHTGGIDNLFPHHENEIAQSECCNGEVFVNYWLHVAHLLIEGEKMSKSLNNFYTLRDMLKKNIDPLVLRYMLLSTHYRNPFNFTFEGVEACAKAMARINKTVQKLNKILKNKESTQNNSEEKEIIKKIETLEKQFYESLANDLNTSMALSKIFDAISFINPFIDNDEVNHACSKRFLDFLRQIDEVFCFIDWQKKSETLPKEVADLLKQRNEARQKKDYRASDELREKMIKLGYNIEDTTKGTTVTIHGI